MDKAPMTIGFAAQTHDVLRYAQEKLRRKGADMIIANQVGLPEQGFNSDYNEVTAIWADGQQKLGYNTKPILADQLIQLIAERYAT